MVHFMHSPTITIRLKVIIVAELILSLYYCHYERKVLVAEIKPSLNKNVVADKDRFYRIK